MERVSHPNAQLFLFDAVLQLFFFFLAKLLFGAGLLFPRGEKLGAFSLAPHAFRRGPYFDIEKPKALVRRSVFTFVTSTSFPVETSRS